MKTFDQFVTEVKRSPERAAKLGDYLAARHIKRDFKYHAKRDWPTTGRVSLADHIQGRYDYEGSDDAALEKGYTHADRLFRKKKWRNIQKIPLKNIRMMQGHADFSGNYYLKHKQDVPRPINVIQTSDHLYHIIDGHHRYLEARLRGDTHIEANVQSHKRAARLK